nr:exonuclease 1 [Ipomoea trifida]
MGIKDLLRFMKPHLEPIHIKKYAGQRVGIDAYSWLHKGAYSCSMELSLDMEGGKKLQYLSYFMHRINLLRHYKITPVVVFDGGNLPCKAATEDERHRKRKANRDQAMAKFKEGDVNAASELFQRAISITPLMAHQLIQILRSDNIEFVVAPYEADAQLAYMSSLEAEKGGIAAVISEDSDLLAYGCPAVVFKMDRYGNGEEVLLDKVLKSGDGKPSFINFSKDLFAGMCVLAGCDFLPSIPGIGIVKAYNFVCKYRNLDRVLSVLKFEKGSQVPEDYSRSFTKAVAVFQHARIYDTVSKQIRHMKPIPEALLQSLEEELDFLGPEMPSSIATAIAEGKLDPCTMEAFDHFPSAESNLYLKNSTRACVKLPSQEAIASPSGKEGGFVAISSRKLRKDAKLEEQEQVSEWNQIPFLDEKKHLAEAIALQKLLNPPSNAGVVEEDKKANPNEALKVPDNNPFRKRCFAEFEPDETESVTEQVSVVTEVESLEVFTTPDSQRSVNSMAVKKPDENRRGKTEKKVKRTNSQSSVTKKSSILNFFSRV